MAATTMAATITAPTTMADTTMAPTTMADTTMADTTKTHSTAENTPAMATTEAKGSPSLVPMDQFLLTTMGRLTTLRPPTTLRQRTQATDNPRRCRPESIRVRVPTILSATKTKEVPSETAS